ncbi:MAG: hypothetical protein A2161_02095 [Candidatus Schekmanbacteria bacterium RBG_13_48_7]|uniref:Aminotransferase class V domain-containing protein n=1 Tax=Candidatus Schekmanbacteria bacterium RBG_13_48_7 TaxID=1817878 RepID=A0A1F7RWY6_9BACT|nr:MAG: hypothetical protein A2161_02095 [Candidatus Schekmanbacteria bacterium RBG_13_48_7]
MRIYLDNNATTPILPEVRDAMLPFLTDYFGNPSSTHSFGRITRKAVETAREQVASLLNGHPSEIVFTSGGTEADNLALFGVCAASSQKLHIIVSEIEHHAVLESAEYLSEQGHEVTYISCNPDGQTNLKDLENKIKSSTRLISVMHSNNETGVIQPVNEFARVISGKSVLLHTDAVQSVGKIRIDVHELGVDLCSLSAHKFGGPKGIGALWVKNGTPLRSILHGGSHEHSLRAGTEAVPNIVGIGKACELASQNLAEREKYLRSLRDHFEKSVFKRIKNVNLNTGSANRLPNTSNLRFPGIEAEALIMKLDLEDVAVSAGSACTAGVVRISHVLNAMGLSREHALASIRFSFGIQTTLKELDSAVLILEKCINQLRN